MNFNYESQITANLEKLDILFNHRNVVFSEEWTATDAPHYLSWDGFIPFLMLTDHD